MSLITRSLLLCLLCLSAACSVVGPTNAPPTDTVATSAPVATLSGSTSTPLPSTDDTLAAFPHCEGMQIQKNPIDFDWPNLEAHLEQFSGSVWMYYTCDQPHTEVAALYREQLLEPPFSLQELNWFEKQEGTLGVYFSQKGSWDYVWILPQPNDAQRSYIIIAESFAYIEC